MKDDLRYTPSDCFETFPFPAALLDSAANDPAHDATRQSLEAIGERYHQFRSELMVRNNEGLTSTYNRFHDPAETSPGLLELRRLHGEMDQAVLAAYGWSDRAHTPAASASITSTSKTTSSSPKSCRSASTAATCSSGIANDALDFQGQLRASGAVKASRKLPWRYRWPDAVRDDVLARLLALNAERYEEEVAMGLHSKGVKQAARAAGCGAQANGGGGRPRPVRRARLRSRRPSRWGWGCEQPGTHHSAHASGAAAPAAVSPGGLGETFPPTAHRPAWLHRPQRGHGEQRCGCVGGTGAPHPLRHRSPEARAGGSAAAPGRPGPDA